MLTFICCIEQGRLERQTLLMLHTLRRFAGLWADADVLAMTPRRGLPLHRSTLQALDALKVQRCLAPAASKLPWFPYANKVAAVALAEQQASTSTLVWLDSDVLVAAPPSALPLDATEDFAARCEYLPPAVHAGQDRNVGYWQAVCRQLGTAYEDLPWLDDGQGRRVRMYFNSGVFSWRRGSGFAAAYEDAFYRLLHSRLAPSDGQFFTADQVVLSPVVMRQRLRWRHLPMTNHHMTFQGSIDGAGASPSMDGSALVHYSKSMDEPYRERFMSRLSNELPALADFVQRHDAALQPRPVADTMARVLRMTRGLHWRLYERSIIPVHSSSVH